MQFNRCSPFRINTQYEHVLESHFQEVYVLARNMQEILLSLACQDIHTSAGILDKEYWDNLKSKAMPHYKDDHNEALMSLFKILMKGHSRGYIDLMFNTGTCKSVETNEAVALLKSSGLLPIKLGDISPIRYQAGALAFQSVRNWNENNDNANKEYVNRCSAYDKAASYNKHLVSLSELPEAIDITCRDSQKVIEKLQSFGDNDQKYFGVRYSRCEDFLEVLRKEGCKVTIAIEVFDLIKLKARKNQQKPYATTDLLEWGKFEKAPLYWGANYVPFDNLYIENDRCYLSIRLLDPQENKLKKHNIPLLQSKYYRNPSIKPIRKAKVKAEDRKLGGKHYETEYKNGDSGKNYKICFDKSSGEAAATIAEAHIYCKKYKKGSGFYVSLPMTHTAKYDEIAQALIKCYKSEPGTIQVDVPIGFRICSMGYNKYRPGCLRTWEYGGGGAWHLVDQVVIAGSEDVNLLNRIVKFGEEIKEAMPVVKWLGQLEGNVTHKRTIDRVSKIVPVDDLLDKDKIKKLVLDKQCDTRKEYNSIRHVFAHRRPALDLCAETLYFTEVEKLYKSYQVSIQRRGKPPTKIGEKVAGFENMDRRRRSRIKDFRQKFANEILQWSKKHNCQLLILEDIGSPSSGGKSHSENKTWQFLAWAEVLEKITQACENFDILRCLVSPNGTSRQNPITRQQMFRSKRLIYGQNNDIYDCDVEVATTNIALRFLDRIGSMFSIPVCESGNYYVPCLPKRKKNGESDDENEIGNSKKWKHGECWHFLVRLFGTEFVVFSKEDCAPKGITAEEFKKISSAADKTEQRLYYDGNRRFLTGGKKGTRAAMKAAVLGCEREGDEPAVGQFFVLQVPIQQGVVAKIKESTRSQGANSYAERTYGKWVALGAG